MYCRGNHCQGINDQRDGDGCDSEGVAVGWEGVSDGGEGAVPFGQEAERDGQHDDVEDCEDCAGGEGEPAGVEEFGVVVWRGG